MTTKYTNSVNQSKIIKPTTRPLEPIGTPPKTNNTIKEKNGWHIDRAFLTYHGPPRSIIAKTNVIKNNILFITNQNPYYSKNQHPYYKKSRSLL